MNMRVNIAGVEWKNPVTVASGTFGSGEEYSDFVDLNKLGAVTTKGVANVPWSGNPTPRVAEVLRRHDECDRICRIRESSCSAKEIFRFLRNTIQRLLSMSADMHRKSILQL